MNRHLACPIWLSQLTYQLRKSMTKVSKGWFSVAYAWRYQCTVCTFQEPGPLNQLSTIEGMDACSSQDCLPRPCIPLQPRSLCFPATHHPDLKISESHTPWMTSWHLRIPWKICLNKPQYRRQSDFRIHIELQIPRSWKLKVKIKQSFVIRSPSPPLVLPTPHTLHRHAFRNTHSK